MFLKTFDSEFSYIEVWLTDQNFNPLKIKGKINITSVINQGVIYKKWNAIQFKQERIFLKGYGFLSLIWVKISVKI